MIGGMTVRRLSAVGVLVVVVVACAPAAGRPTVPYLAVPQEIISAVAQFGPQMEPPAGYNFFSIETIGDGYITLRADVTTGVAILGAFGGTSSPPARITVTTLEQADVTNVAVSILPASSGDLYDKLIRELDVRFRRAPAQGAAGK
jgi:hypothetical protein